MRPALVILWILLLSPCSVPADKPASRSDDGRSSSTARDPVFDSQLSDILQKALEEAARVQQADGISASVYISDQCYWEGASGVTKQDPGTPVESDMLFRFASITKTFVAAIVLQLVEEGKLGLGDTLGKWLEEYPNIDPDITVHQLLNHSSGLNGYLNNKRFWPDVEADLDRVWSPEEILKYVGLPKAWPGDGEQYSNTNYILLGMIVESATGNPVEQELEERVFRPLRLDHTYLPKKDFDPRRWANNTALSSSLYSSVWTAGAIASISKDVAKWAHTLYSGNFLQAASLEKMLVVKMTRIGRHKIPMGMGVWKLSVEGEVAWGHGGWLGDDVLARMFYVPKLRLGVAYSSSGADAFKQHVPGSHLVRAYIDNRPDDISLCFDSPEG